MRPYLYRIPATAVTRERRLKASRKLTCLQRAAARERLLAMLEDLQNEERFPVSDVDQVRSG